MKSFHCRSQRGHQQCENRQCNGSITAFPCSKQHVCGVEHRKSGTLQSPIYQPFLSVRFPSFPFFPLPFSIHHFTYHLHSLTQYISVFCFFFWFYQSATPHRLFELKGCNNRLLVLEKKLDGALIWFCFFAISPLHWIARACYIFSFCLCACVSLFCVIILQKPHKGAAPCELTATRMQAFFFLPDSFPISFHHTATIRLNGDAPGIPVHLFVG